MAKKHYRWSDGAVLGEHSKSKLKILDAYLSDYLKIRCGIPQQTKFRLAVVDGFCGGGIYDCGTYGSPIVFIKTLSRESNLVNLRRIQEGLGKIEFECLLLFNDADETALALLKPLLKICLEEVRLENPNLKILVELYNYKFEAVFPKIKRCLKQYRFRNVIFNLDQYSYGKVEKDTLVDIMDSYRSAEVFYTFSIQSLITFLPKKNQERLKKQLLALGVDSNEITRLDEFSDKQGWLGAAERIVFESFRGVSQFVSPFSINNPNGWRYWLMHFSNSHVARRAYNNVLHENSSVQAHFGRSGLNMLQFDPLQENGSLYLFESDDRLRAKEQLLEDVPRWISESGDAIRVEDFYTGIYNTTPAHVDDIHASLIQHPDIEIVTPGGGIRRSANQISPADVLKLKRQLSFFPVLGPKLIGD